MAPFTASTAKALQFSSGAKHVAITVHHGVDLIVRAGGSVWIDDNVRIVHAKAMVIDGKVTLVGSMNWSRDAALNSEDLNLVVSAEVAETCATHWRQRRSVSVPFTGRDQWCRRHASGGGA